MEDYDNFAHFNYSQFNSSWNHTLFLQWMRRHRQYMEHEYVPDVCFPLLDLLDLFHLYYIPAIILVGLVGNLLSCIVFLNTHLKMRSSSYYLAALATADFGFLATLLMVWLNNNLGVQVRYQSNPFTQTGHSTGPVLPPNPTIVKTGIQNLSVQIFLYILIL